MSFDRNLLPDASTYFENQGLQLKGPPGAKWKTTSCNFHGGSDSMRVQPATGAWVCMSCGEKGGDVLAYEMAATGTEFMDAAKALGAWVDDGRPPERHKPRRLSPRQALAVVRFESNLVAIAACNVANGTVLSAADLARLRVSARRITQIEENYS